MTSNGTTGERMAEIWFRQNNWYMTRTQPETKVVKVSGKLITVNCGRGGVADYTGYKREVARDIPYPMYRAMEVKEADGKTMPASRLSKEQRKWMDAIDCRSAFVGICWMDNPVTFEIFKYIPKGSYKRGSGV